jgi:hypothetical protein
VRVEEREVYILKTGSNHSSPLFLIRKLKFLTPVIDSPPPNVISQVMPMTLVMETDNSAFYRCVITLCLHLQANLR